MNSTTGFHRVAKNVSTLTGRPVAFVTAIAVLLIWAAFGPVSGYSDTWQLVINTATTVITFLMVFLIQNTQNRDAAAIQLKLDEIIRALENADNDLLDLEDLDDAKLDEMHRKYAALAARARAVAVERGSRPT